MEAVREMYMKKNLSIIILVLSLFLCLTIIGIGAVVQPADLLPNPVDEQILTLDTAFTGDSKTPVSLPSFFDIEDELRLRIPLTYRFTEYTSPSFIVQANHSFMTILLDGREIYRVEPTQHSLGNYFVNIPLPPQLNDSEIEICITVPKGGINRIEFPAPIVMNESVFLRQNILSDAPSLILNTLILFCGLFVIGLSISNRKHIAVYPMLMQGLLALCCAVYFFCETLSVVYLASSAWMVYLIDLFSFSLIAPLFLTLMIWELSSWRKQLIQTIVVLGLCNVVVQAVLGLTGLAELRKMLPLTHLIQAASILAIVICMLYCIVKHIKMKNLLCYGLIVLGTVLDLTLFYFEARLQNMFFAKFALLLYFVQQIYVFVQQLMKQSADNARENYYKTLALQDSLTGCFSRAAFEVDRMSMDHTDVYTVFSVDLNNLKQANDLYGHSMGDQLLHAMGNVLKQSFPSKSKCYRTGGDEFWVFCKGLTSGQAQELVNAIHHATNLYNMKQNPPVRLSYAIGYCDTVETDGNLDLAIESADARMYEQKRQLKGLKR